MSKVRKSSLLEFYIIINFQRCTQQFQAQGNAEEFVELVVDTMRYIGPEDLTQYFIRNTTMRLSDDKKSVIVEAWANYSNDSNLNYSNYSNLNYSIYSNYSPLVK